MAANSGTAAADDWPDLNTGNEWSEMDLFDFAITVRTKNSIEFIAIFLGRSRREVRDKIAELERSGKLGRLIERIEAFSLDGLRRPLLGMCRYLIPTKY